MTGHAQMTSDGERIAVLEANQRHMGDKIDAMAGQLQEVHDLLLKAKGAKWAIIGLATLGGFVSAKIGAVAALFEMPFGK
jgi:predicted esterase YcpF (UPF0227 family)